MDTVDRQVIRRCSSPSSVDRVRRQKGRETRERKEEKKEGKGVGNMWRRIYIESVLLCRHHKVEYKTEESTLNICEHPDASLQPRKWFWDES